MFSIWKHRWIENITGDPTPPFKKLIGYASVSKMVHLISKRQKIFISVIKTQDGCLAWLIWKFCWTSVESVVAWDQQWLMYHACFIYFIVLILNIIDTEYCEHIAIYVFLLQVFSFCFLIWNFVEKTKKTSAQMTLRASLPTKSTSIAVPEYPTNIPHRPIHTSKPAERLKTTF